MRLVVIAMVATASTGCFDWDSLSPEEVCAGADSTPVAADYVFHLLPAGATVTESSTCDEPFWANVPVIELEDINPTNNSVSCRMVWQPAAMLGEPDVVYGCCTVVDTDLQAVYDASAHDQDSWADDSFEYYLTREPKVRDDSTTKTSINIRGSVFDVDFDDDIEYDTTYEGDVVARTEIGGQTINDSANLDTGYTIKWRANVGFAVPAQHVAGCGFMSADTDDGVRQLWNAFGDGREDINDWTKWGRCLFSCSEPPAP